MSNFCLDWGTQPASSACNGFFTTAADNGTLRHKIDFAGGPSASSSLPSFSHTYGYDNLNRLTGDTDSGGASRSMAYDQWGNMATTGVIWSGLTPTSTSGFNANNRLSSSLFNYDNAGNMTLLGSIGIGYDAENRQVSSSDSTLHVQVGYNYDGVGDRVLKTVTNGPTTVYVYDALGQLAAEYTSATSTQPCATCYLSYDHLGSVRMVTDPVGNVVARHDYVPFGEEVPSGSYGRSGQFGASDDVRQRFTGQERDSENTPALDYFNARYMASILGRFGSPDPGNAGADPSNPQSWNGYSYVLNNPLIFVDPSGMDPGDGGDSCDGDPFCGDDPPPIFGQPSAPPSPVTVEEPLPPGSFPGGESLGLPPGAQLPGPFGIGLPDPFIFSFCQQSDPDCVAAGVPSSNLNKLQIILDAICSEIPEACLGQGMVIQPGDPRYQNVEELIKKLYPKKANLTEMHHTLPIYMGGAPNGQVVPLNGAYHQAITNAFRKEWAYGRGAPPPSVIQEIVDKVYKYFPLP